MEKTALSKKQWLAALIYGCVYTSFGNLQYLVQYYYVIYQEANGLTDGQMGKILTYIGIAATLAYFINGFITDMVKPRTLLILTLSLAVAGGVLLMFNLGYIASIVVFCMFALLPLWSPMSKLFVSIANTEESDRMFGLLDFFAAAASMLAGTVAGIIVAKSGSKMAVVGLCAFYTVINVVGLIATFVLTKDVDMGVKEKSSEDGFSLKNLILLFRDPDQWLLWLGIAFGYTGYIGVSYIAPMLADVYGMSTSTVTFIETYVVNAIGLIAPLISGRLAAKMGAVRSYFVWLGFYVASMVLVLFLPWQASLSIVAILALVLVTFSVKGRSAISNSVLNDAKTPLYLFGTSVSIQAVFMSIPDTFVWDLAGKWLDAYGNDGYRYIFYLSLAFALAGLVCNIILDRRMKAGKDSEWFFKTHHKAE